MQGCLEIMQYEQEVRLSLGWAAVFIMGIMQVNVYPYVIKNAQA